MHDVHIEPAGRSVPDPALFAALWVDHDEDAVGYECALPFFDGACTAPADMTTGPALAPSVQSHPASRGG